MYRDSAPGSIARGPQRVEGIGEETGKANHSDPTHGHREVAVFVIALIIQLRNSWTL